ncbi:MAG: hypothetical protein E6I90_14020 [Chloroflexi bacterium]|nr:MAG: hypothetical protein E6I90_14020 [Chloroflexota bacterium]
MIPSASVQIAASFLRKDETNSRMETRSHLLQLAAYNNAVWCDSVCRSHNVPGEFLETVWVNRHQTPVYYPNLVTLSSAAERDLQKEPIVDLLTAKRGHTVSVKDSFARLDLAPFGFHHLFQAQWILRQAHTAFRGHATTDLRWERIVSEEELARWEEAWSGTAPSTNRLFLPALLENAEICIMAAYIDHHIVAGAIANRTTEVVGLSNTFTPPDGAELYWEGFLGMIGTHYPSLPIVGYERDESLTIALHVGFTTLGPLSVWIEREVRD